MEKKCQTIPLLLKSLTISLRKIGKTVSESVPSPTVSFHSHVKDTSAVKFFMQPTYINEITNLEKESIKTKCTVCFDSLSIKPIQRTIEEIVIPLDHIINQSFVTRVVPENLKIAKVIPIYKSGIINGFNTYRPISILPALSKITNNIVCNKLVN